MSHTVKINVEFKELQCLKNAFLNLGWRIAENTRIRAYSQSQSREFPVVAINPAQYGYDVGIEQNNGKYDIFTDFFGGSVESTLGTGMSKLKQQYSLEMLQQELGSQGYMLTSLPQEDGSILVEAEATS